MARNTGQQTHPRLSVTVTIGTHSYPVNSFVVTDNRQWDRKASDYIQVGPDILSATVTREVFGQIVATDYTLLNNLSSYDEQGERVKRLRLDVSPDLIVYCEVPRKPDVECPKCLNNVYTDELCNEWDSVRIVMGKDHYGRLCKACWDKYQAAQQSPVPPVQVDTSSDTNS